MISLSSAQVERDVEASRDRLSATISDLRENLTPRQLLNEYVGEMSMPRAMEWTQRAISYMQRRPLPVMLLSSGGALSGLFLMRRDSRKAAAPGSGESRLPAAGVELPRQSSVSARSLMILTLAAAVAGMTIGAKSKESA